MDQAITATKNFYETELRHAFFDAKKNNCRRHREPDCVERLEYKRCRRRSADRPGSGCILPGSALSEYRSQYFVCVAPVRCAGAYRRKRTLDSWAGGFV